MLRRARIAGVAAGLMLASAWSATAAPVIDFLGRSAKPCGDEVISWPDIASTGALVDECDGSGDFTAVVDPMAGGGGGGIALMSALFWPGRALTGRTLMGPPLVNDGQLADVFDPDLSDPDSPESTTTGEPTRTPAIFRHPPSIDGLGSFGERSLISGEGSSIPPLSPGFANPGAINPAVVPEPGTLLLFGTGLALAARRIRRRRAG